MSLQICRSRFNFDPAARRLHTLFVPAVWQGCAQSFSFLLNLMGALFMHIMLRRNVFVTNSLARTRTGAESIATSNRLI
jgi:hypothetical protein